MNNIKGLEDGVEKIKPILSLLDDGYYLIKEIDYFPTDGEGDFFWKLNRESKRYSASSEYYYEEYGDCITLEPKFLLPSQGTNSYNKERVEFYRDKIRRGEKLFGLAIINRGYLSTLLDGHHKATACYLEGKSLTCITIVDTYFNMNYTINEEYLYYMGNTILARNLKSAREIREFFSAKGEERDIICEEIKIENSYNRPIEIEKKKIYILSVKNMYYQKYQMNRLKKSQSVHMKILWKQLDIP